MATLTVDLTDPDDVRAALAALRSLVPDDEIDHDDESRRRPDDLNNTVLTKVLGDLANNAAKAVRLVAENRSGIKSETIQRELGLDSWNQLAGAMASVGMQLRKHGIDRRDALYQVRYRVYTMDPSMAARVLKIMDRLGR